MHTILLVDDDPLVRNIVGKMLERSGYGVIKAKDGQSALEALHERGRPAVDLVIADYAMPGMDGLALARRIKESAPDLPMAIMADHSDLECYLCASSLGVRSIGKPVQLRELYQTIRKTVADGSSKKALPDNRAA